jgi:hypothetical protein
LHKELCKNTFPGELSSSPHVVWFIVHPLVAKRVKAKAKVGITISPAQAHQKQPACAPRCFWWADGVDPPALTGIPLIKGDFGVMAADFLPIGGEWGKFAILFSGG